MFEHTTDFRRRQALTFCRGLVSALEEAIRSGDPKVLDTVLAMLIRTVPREAGRLLVNIYSRRRRCDPRPRFDAVGRVVVTMQTVERER
jgi:hypothetical protein